MLAEWIAECSADDPTLVVPWSAPAEQLAFVNLRENPYDVADIAEAERYPALGRALRALNASRSPFLTAKCDVWPLPEREHADTLAAIRAELILDPEEGTSGVGSYIDLLWRERNVFASAHQQTDRLERLVRRAEKLAQRESALQFVLRPAVVDFGVPLEGFATTVYVTSLGPDAHTARARWDAALEALVHVLRGRDLEVPRGSATIDSVTPDRAGE